MEINSGELLLAPGAAMQVAFPLNWLVVGFMIIVGSRHHMAKPK